MSYRGLISYLLNNLSFFILVLVCSPVIAAWKALVYSLTPKALEGTTIPICNFVVEEGAVSVAELPGYPTVTELLPSAVFGADMVLDLVSLKNTPLGANVVTIFIEPGSLALDPSPSLIPSRCLLFSLPPTLIAVDSRGLEEVPILTPLLPRGVTTEVFRAASPMTKQKHTMTITHVIQPSLPCQYLLLLLLDIAVIVYLYFWTLYNTFALLV